VELELASVQVAPAPAADAEAVPPAADAEPFALLDTPAAHPAVSEAPSAVAAAGEDGARDVHGALPASSRQTGEPKADPATLLHQLQRGVIPFGGAGSSGCDASAPAAAAAAAAAPAAAPAPPAEAALTAAPVPEVEVVSEPAAAAPEENRRGGRAGRKRKPAAYRPGGHKYTGTRLPRGQDQAGAVSMVEASEAGRLRRSCSADHAGSIQEGGGRSRSPGARGGEGRSRSAHGRLGREGLRW
jgi:hypothetical protein